MAFESIATELMDYCRACMLFDSTSKMQFLYTNDLDHVYSECTSLEITKNDSLPLYICQDCYQQLQNFNQFRQQCQTSERTFRHKIKWEKDDDEDYDNTNLIPSIFPIEQYNINTQCIAGTDSPNNPFVIKSEAHSDSEQDAISAEAHSDSEQDAISAEAHSDSEQDAMEDTQLDVAIENFQPTTDAPLFTCDLCSKSFPAKHKIYNHLKNHIKVKQGPASKYVCKICGQKYLKKHRLDGHMRTHQGLKPFLCTICGKDFMKHNNFVLHNKIKHTNFEKFKCDFEGCNKAFSFKRSLKSHKECAHMGKVTERHIVCEECGKTYPCKAALKLHQFSHTGERPYKCEYCPKGFITPFKVKEHTMRCQKLGKHICTICGKRHVTEKELKLHQRKHIVSNKLISCELCSEAFANKTQVRKHTQKVHPKPYDCTRCKRSFSKETTLNNHLLKHTKKERPLVCYICDEGFRKKLQFKKHLKKHEINDSIKIEVL